MSPPKPFLELAAFKLLEEGLVCFAGRMRLNYGRQLHLRGWGLLFLGSTFHISVFSRRRG